MEKIRFAVEISNSSVEKLWELLLGDGFFEFLPSFKKRIDTKDGFTIVLKHHKFSVVIWCLTVLFREKCRVIRITLNFDLR